MLLGAARSGTKLLRDLLASSPGARAVPYDINYVWRYGQERAPDDVLDPNARPPGLARHVRRQIDRMAPGDEPLVIEKTVSNVLRIPYVAAALPRAQYVYLERHGEDVVESAMRCWRSPLGATNLTAKLWTFPWWTAGRYALSYARDLGKQLLTRDPVSTWGPRYPGIDEDVRMLPLVDVCARQWVACVTAFARYRDMLEDLTIVQYEELVQDPAGVGARLASTLELDVGAVTDAAAQMVHRDGLDSAQRSGQDITAIRQAIERARAQVGKVG